MNYICTMHTFTEAGRIRKVFTLDVIGTSRSSNLITVELHMRPVASVIVIDGAEDLDLVTWLGAVLLHIVDVSKEAR